MRIIAGITLLAAPLLGACAHHVKTAQVEPGPAAITIERGPCFGACPVYSATIRPDGEGSFAGRRFVAIADERQFKIAPETFQRIRHVLASYRPAGTEERIGAEGCSAYATDHPSWTIRWTEQGGETHTLHYDTGCHDDRYRGLAEAIRATRALMPIDALVGRRDG